MGEGFSGPAQSFARLLARAIRLTLSSLTPQTAIANVKNPYILVIALNNNASSIVRG